MTQKPKFKTVLNLKHSKFEFVWNLKIVVWNLKNICYQQRIIQ